MSGPQKGNAEVVDPEALSSLQIGQLLKTVANICSQEKAKDCE